MRYVHKIKPDTYGSRPGMTKIEGQQTYRNAVWLQHGRQETKAAPAMQIDTPRKSRTPLRESGNPLATAAERRPQAVLRERLKLDR